MKPLVVCIFLLLATGCAPLNPSSFPVNTQRLTTRWRIQYSPSMPPGPTVGGPGAWYFDFPSDPNYPECVPNLHCRSVNYVTNSYSGPATQSVSMTFQVLTTGAPAFNYVMETDNTCATPATVRLFLERRNDDFSREFYRWWANPTAYELQATSGNITMTVPLTPDRWSSVYGKAGDYDATALAGFQDALRDLGDVGMTFGGGCFFGHGVNVTGGTARFVLMSYTIA